ncbi:MAG: biotin/lipoyl-binding protein [Propionibacteriaceae bacterium]|jgi:glutaconyl-CoA decarboxylase|nr:biotin/lipoyl-binding protein [Propionibacteriaceae bacterium]
MTHYAIRVGDTVHSIDVEDKGSAEFTVRLEDGREFTAALVSDQAAQPLVDRSEADRRDGAASPPVADAPPEKVTRVAAPLPCLVLSVAVRPGDRVTRGQTILQIEAMKMRNDILAPRDATVSKVLVAAGDTVPHGRPLVEFED